MLTKYCGFTLQDIQELPENEYIMYAITANQLITEENDERRKASRGR